jgi:LemA protein
MSGVIVAVGAAVVALLLVVWVIVTYNRLVSSRNAYQQAFAQIDVQLTRRHTLIPNLVETAKGYLAHERETLDAVVSARSRAIDAQPAAAANPGHPPAMHALAAAENTLTLALSQLFVVSEAYPQLKSNQNMLQLMEELTSAENRVAFARQRYNDAVMHYNNRRETVPASMFAGMLGFGPAALFEIDAPDQRQAPHVSF